MNIVFTDCHTMNPGDLDWTSFDGLGQCIYYPYTSQEDLKERVEFADVIVANKTVLSADLIRSCQSLKLICVSATGFNNVDVQAASDRGIPVCNAADYSSHSVAQHVFASVLKVYNNIAYYSKGVHDGRWQSSRDFSYYDEPIEELYGKKLGIIGYGNIGQRVADIGRAFGMEILVQKHPSKELKLKDVRLLDSEQFLAESDIVSVHVPLRKETNAMINRSFLKAMKGSAILVNTARGPILDEHALKEALENQWIRAACIDVLTVEPPEDSVLFGVDRCIITPHQAWASKQARIRLMGIVASNIKAFQAGGLQNQVN